MKTFKIFFRPISFLFAFLILFVSCTQYDEGVTIIEKNYSGEELFRGIYFSDGEIAQRIPSLKFNNNMIADLSIEQKLELDKFQSQIVEHLKGIDPNYFENFKHTITSNDIYKIEKHLEMVSRDIASYVEILLAEKGTNLNEIKKLYDNELAVNPDEIFSGVALALLITVVIVIAIAINVTVTKTKTEDVLESPETIYSVAKLLQGENSLNRQQFILEISKL